MTWNQEEWEAGILAKIDFGEKLSESELCDLRESEISRDEGEDRRWLRSILSLLKLGERHFTLAWEKGLTENQDDEFYQQPVELFNPVKKERVITEITWHDSDNAVKFVQVVKPD